MASRRKRYRPSRRPDLYGDPAEYAKFLADLLEGSITATRLVEERGPNGKLELSYDDPQG